VQLEDVVKHAGMEVAQLQTQSGQCVMATAAAVAGFLLLSCICNTRALPWRIRRVRSWLFGVIPRSTLYFCYMVHLYCCFSKCSSRQVSPALLQCVQPILTSNNSHQQQRCESPGVSHFWKCQAGVVMVLGPLLSLLALLLLPSQDLLEKT
jgi:hypothetical protein